MQIEFRRTGSPEYQLIYADPRNARAMNARYVILMIVKVENTASTYRCELKYLCEIYIKDNAKVNYFP